MVGWCHTLMVGWCQKVIIATDLRQIKNDGSLLNSKKLVILTVFESRSIAKIAVVVFTKTELCQGKINLKQILLALFSILKQKK